MCIKKKAQNALRFPRKWLLRTRDGVLTPHSSVPSVWDLFNSSRAHTIWSVGILKPHVKQREAGLSLLCPRPHHLYLR